MLKNGGLDPEYFCVTESDVEARAFFQSGKSGCIALRNDETVHISTLLREFNTHIHDHDYYAYDAQLIALMANILKRITGKDIQPDLVKPHIRSGLGWNDPPHSDGAGTVLLCGYERPTEISTCPPQTGFLEPKIGEIEWGNFDDEKDHPQYCVQEPISFLMATLIILTAPKGDNRRTMHRIPRRLYAGEERGFILKAGYTY